MIINRDLTDVPDGNYPLIPDGKYLVSIASIADKKTQTHGDDMLNIKYVVVDGEHSGKILFDNIVIPVPESPAWSVMGRFRNFLHCIGEDYSGKVSVDTDEWKGKEVMVNITTETYNGIPRNKVKNYILMGAKENPTEVTLTEEEKEEVPF